MTTVAELCPGMNAVSLTTIVIEKDKHVQSTRTSGKFISLFVGDPSASIVFHCPAIYSAKIEVGDMLRLICVNAVLHSGKLVLNLPSSGKIERFGQDMMIYGEYNVSHLEWVTDRNGILMKKGGQIMPPRGFDCFGSAADAGNGNNEDQTSDSSRKHKRSKNT